MKIKFLILSLALTGCVSLSTVSVTSIPKEKSKKVKAETEKLLILGINADNNYVDSLVPDLARKCSKGSVQGILTKHEYTNYILAWKSRVTAEGYCVEKP